MLSGTDMLATGSFVTEWHESSTIEGLIYHAELSREEALQLLRRVNLPAALLDQADFQVSTQDYSRFLGDLLAHLSPGISAAAFAARVASRVHVSHFGVLGLALQNAPSIQEAINLALDYRHLLAGNTRLTCIRRHDVLDMEYSYTTADAGVSGTKNTSAVAQFSLVVDMMTANRLFEDLLGRTCNPIQIELPFDTPDDATLIDTLSPCPVVYNAPRCCFTFPVNILGDSPPRASALAYKRFLRDIENTLLATQQRKTLPERVRDLLWAHSPPLSRRDIARTLAVSERTLSRALQAADTSYQALLNRVKTDRAVLLLQQADMPVSEISTRLGYSDPAAFSRAFKETVGIAPSRWRSNAVNSD